MSFFSDICHEGLLCELQKEIHKTMILYTVDGYAYYGKLSHILEDRVAVLVPGAGQTDVIVRHPDQTFGPQGNAAIRETITAVDLCTVVAKTVGLNEIPPLFGY